MRMYDITVFDLTEEDLRKEEHVEFQKLDSDETGNFYLKKDHIKMDKEDKSTIEKNAKKLLEKTSAQTNIKDQGDNLIEYRDFLNIVSSSLILSKMILNTRLNDHEEDKKKLLEMGSKKLYTESVNSFF